MMKTARNMKLLKHLSGIVIAMAALLCAPSLLAQTVTGNITGIVTDSSGAIVAGATVTARNQDTGVASPTTTNSSGFYSIQFLPIGHYDVTVQATGFGTETVPPFTLEILQTATFNVHLKVGSTAETVDVSTAAPILNTNDANLGVTFSTNEIQNVPLNGLNFSTLTMFLPGAVNTNGNSGQSGNNAIERDTYYSDIPSINGNRSQANNYTLDGIDMNEPANNLIGYNPAPEALQEIKVLTANSPAEYGNANGGGVVSVLKSGTNHFHGSVYGYLQNDKLNANTWNNDNATPVIPINPFTQSQFGATLGGPIKRDKLFFFVDYIGARFHTGGTGQASVLTQAMRNGDFSALLNPPPGANGATNAPIQLYDSQNNFAPYKNNQVQVLNPVATFLFANPSLYPLPNAAPTDGVIANNYQGPTRVFTANNQGDAKIEYNPRSSDKISGFYGMSSAYDGSTAVLAISFPPLNQYPTKLGGVTWTHIFSPSIINSARVGFTRIIWRASNPTDPTGQFGLTGNAKVGIAFGTQTDPGFSYQNIGGGAINAGGTPAFDADITDNTFTYTDNLTWQHGVHLISLGIQALRYQDNYTTNNNAGFLGTLSYSGAYTSNPDPTAINGIGYGGADFVLNRVVEAAVTSQGIRVGQRQWRTAGFAQDDWKVLPNLTLNIGLRYEFDQPWYEQNNKTGNILLGTGQTVYAGSIPTGAPAGSGLCGNRACYQPTYNQIMPRLGFAYQANNRFVVRGGYGATSFFEGDAGNQRLTSITPFVQSVDIKPLTPTPGNGGQPRTAQQGFGISNAGDINFNGSSYNVYPQHIQPAYVQEWSLTTEYAVTHTTSFQVGYLGEQGQHIEDYGNVNQYTVNGDPTSAPYFNNAALGIGSGNLLITESRAMMNYNALQTTVRQRASHGLEFTLNYTYGKAMTNSLGNYALNVNGYSGAFQNYYDSHADYGLAGTDVTNNFSGLFVYALPVGHGKQFGSGANRVVDEIIGGWKISGSGFSYSGLPQSISGPGNNSNSYGVSRANQYRPLKIVHQSIAHWFGTDPSATPCTVQGVDNGSCAFGAAAPNTFGTSSNGSVRGPGFRTADASAFKDFHIYEEQIFNFRFDAFNVFNHPSYTNPDTGITDGTFGQAIGVRSQERRIQLSAKYSF
jgi:hypothetical protein